MSILNIKERFSKRILESEKEASESKTVPKVNETDNTVYSILESDVGITEYLTNSKGFHAIIKQRFSDFNVHEIDLDGKIVVLDSYELPDESIQPEALEIDILEQVTLDNLEKLANGDENIKSVLIEVTEKSKEERTKIHQFVKAKYGKDIRSNSSNIEDKKFIIITKEENECPDKRRAGHLPKFLRFVLSKSNMDTNAALNLISSKLRIKPANISFAGTKDKRANTTQQISIKNAYAKQVKDIQGLRNIWIGNFSYNDKGLRLGQLKGNNFQIALRDVVEADDIVIEGLEKLKELGFINYFGLQRFGNSRESATHEIGKLLIKEAYKQAVELILKPRSALEAPDIRQAREIWARTKDARQALKACHGTRSIEAKLLLGLKDNGNSAFLNSLNNLPRNIRLLYIHSYQSYIWNLVVSRRVATHGLKLLEGDLISKSDNLDGECQDLAAEEDVEVSADETVDKIQFSVEYITAENISNYTIYDIVMPLPGHSIQYPKNETLTYYQEFLKQDDLTTDSFVSKDKKYSLSGNYRKIVVKPENLSWKIVRYNQVNDDLILSDVDILSGKHLNVDGGEHRAVILNMNLPSSTYATMALRELLKADTSKEHQTHLNSRLKRKTDLENGSDGEEKRLKLEDGKD